MTGIEIVNQLVGDGHFASARVVLSPIGELCRLRDQLIVDGAPPQLAVRMARRQLAELAAVSAA